MAAWETFRLQIVQQILDSNRENILTSQDRWLNVFCFGQGPDSFAQTNVHDLSPSDKEE
ncbi:MAG: hypothetical protein WCA10_13025 [Terracidiphilus sp.]